MKQHVPALYDLFRSLCNVGETSDENPVVGKEVYSVMSLSTLAKGNSSKLLGLQLLIGLMLLARSTSKRVMAVLNHAGVSVSYDTAWKYLIKLTSEAQYQQRVQTGRWIWVFDNLNIHQRVRHERQDVHNTMLNITSRLAVAVRKIPPGDVDWNDHQPQKPRESLTVSDILPSQQDSQEFERRAVEYMVRFLVTEFDSLSGLKRHSLSNHLETAKDEVVPMTALFKDEKYVSEVIDIITQFRLDADLSGEPQVVVGDQLTCKNIRSSRLWRQSELNTVDRLTWANEIPGTFHFLWECLRVVYAIFWGTPSQHGSLCNLREVGRRTQVAKGVKVFNVCDEFLKNAFHSHLRAAIFEYFKISSTSATIEHSPTKHWLYETAAKIVSKAIIPAVSDDPTYYFHRLFTHHCFMYTDLREAIRWENGPHIVRHWKWWLPSFLATGRKNYACEAVNFVANLQADFPRHVAFLATHHQTVNMTGKPGRGKPVDQLMEHYNLIFKQALRSAGGQLTTKHVESVSMGVLFLMEACQKADGIFGLTSQSTAHTVRDVDSDVKRMADHLTDKQVCKESEKRRSPVFQDPTQSGWKKLSTTSWLKDALARRYNDDENEQSENDDLQLDETDMDILP